MTLESFKEVYKDKSPVFKLDLLLEQADIYASDRVAAVQAGYRTNTEDAVYWQREMDHIQKRMLWLAEELKGVLANA